MSLDKALTGPLTKLLTVLLPSLIPPGHLLRHDFNRLVHLPKFLQNPLPMLDADPVMQHEPTGDWPHGPEGQIMGSQGAWALLGVVCLGHAHRISQRVSLTKTLNLAGGGKVPLNRGSASFRFGLACDLAGHDFDQVFDLLQPGKNHVGVRRAALAV